MKRNLDTVRKLLALAEEQPAGKPLMTFSGEFDNTPVEVVEHIKLMIDAGLIDGEAYADPEKKEGGIFVIEKLTWACHDFLNAARNDNVWNSTKRRIAKVGSRTFG